MKAFILAGGKGTRLAPFTTVFPKPMLPIDETPILEIVIRQLVYYKFKEIIISVGHLAELIKAYFNTYNNLPSNVKLSYVREKHPLGTAGSVSLISPPPNSFLVMNGDVLTTLNYRKLMEFHKKNGCVMTVAMHKNEVKVDYGVLSITDFEEIVKYEEKPTLDYLVSTGIYVLEPDVFKYIEKNKKLDMPVLINRLLSKGEKVKGFFLDDYWLDIGMPEHYEQAIKNFKVMKNKLIKSL